MRPTQRSALAAGFALLTGIVLVGVAACEPSLPKAPRIELEGGPREASVPDVTPLVPPVWVSCVTGFTCSEVEGQPDALARVRARCTKAGSEVREHRCSTEDTVGRCVVAEVGVTIVTYKGTSDEETKARADQAPSSCSANGGKYTPTK